MLAASQVADFFIAYSHEHGDPISNLKLQKLLYYAQAWHLAIFDSPLFPEPIQAWIHGPVVPAAYQRFKGWAWMDITEDPGMPELSAETRAHLEEVYDVYGRKTAYELELLTHEEAPWQAARAGLPDDVSCTNEISHERMKAFYRARMNGKN